MLRMEAGNRLKSLQPFTAREASLALLMGAGADIRIVFGVASLPFLAQSVKDRSYNFGTLDLYILLTAPGLKNTVVSRIENLVS